MLRQKLCVANVIILNYYGIILHLVWGQLHIYLYVRYFIHYLYFCYLSFGLYMYLCGSNCICIYIYVILFTVYILFYTCISVIFVVYVLCTVC